MNQTPKITSFKSSRDFIDATSNKIILEWTTEYLDHVDIEIMKDDTTKHMIRNLPANGRKGLSLSYDNSMYIIRMLAYNRTTQVRSDFLITIKNLVPSLNKATEKPKIVSFVSNNKSPNSIALNWKTKNVNFVDIGLLVGEQLVPQIRRLPANGRVNLDISNYDNTSRLKIVLTAYNSEDSSEKAITINMQNIKKRLNYFFENLTLYPDSIFLLIFAAFPLSYILGVFAISPLIRGGDIDLFDIAPFRFTDSNAISFFPLTFALIVSVSTLFLSTKKNLLMYGWGYLSVLVGLLGLFFSDSIYFQISFLWITMLIGFILAFRKNSGELLGNIILGIMAIGMIAYFMSFFGTSDQENISTQKNTSNNIFDKIPLFQDKIGNSVVTVDAYSISVDDVPYPRMGIKSITGIDWGEFSFSDFDEIIYENLTTRSFSDDEVAIKMRFIGTDGYGHPKHGEWITIGEISVSESKKYKDYSSWKRRYNSHDLYRRHD